MRLKDLSTRYGLVSILLHWSTAIVIIAMLMIGNAIAAATGNVAHLLSIHTGLATVAYPLLWWRIGWRLRYGHPNALPRQNRRLISLAKMIHYAVVVLIALMLVSGPIMAWSGGIPVSVFGWTRLPAPWGPNPDAYVIAHQLHVFGGSALLTLVVGHIGAALLHIMFKRDGTLDKMLIAPRTDTPPRT